jgi:hypothetical protein
MEKQKAPDVTPEWKTTLIAMLPYKRVLLAVSLGVTERSIFNWAKGISHPSPMMVQRIISQLKKIKE